MKLLQLVLYNSLLSFSLHSAYKKFTNIDPMCFFDNRKGHISFLSVAELLPELAVREDYHTPP